MKLQDPDIITGQDGKTCGECIHGFEWETTCDLSCEDIRPDMEACEFFDDGD
jgi:hypothetical protein